MKRDLRLILLYMLAISFAAVLASCKSKHEVVKMSVDSLSRVKVKTSIDSAGKTTVNTNLVITDKITEHLSGYFKETITEYDSVITPSGEQKKKKVTTREYSLNKDLNSSKNSVLKKDSVGKVDLSKDIKSNSTIKTDKDLYNDKKVDYGGKQVQAAIALVVIAVLIFAYLKWGSK